ncbi:MAG: hypothetical protein ACTJFQ_17840 [Vreelandella alkaliphila]|uniref:hypothetical protein n=1 Tax=Vreelandella alkaliphila TaxID=272774 RepID=UPI003F9A4BDF
MSLERNSAYLSGLLAELRKLPSETSWLEFKRNNADPHEIGEYIAALSNAAALEGKSAAYMVWAVIFNPVVQIAAFKQPVYYARFRALFLG